MSINHQHCPKLSLAASDIGHVTICPSCNVITVTVQSVSLRFEPPAFDELARMTGQARAALLRSVFAFAPVNPDSVEASQSATEREPRH